MKFFKKLKEGVKKIESDAKKLKKKLKTAPKLKKLRTISNIAVPIIAPFIPPFAGAMPLIDGIPRAKTNDILVKGINFLTNK